MNAATGESLPPVFSDDEMIAELQTWMERGCMDMNLVVGGLRRVAFSDPPSWKRFRDSLGFERTNSTFTEFVTEKPPKGIGASTKLIVHLVEDDPQLSMKVHSLLGQDVPAAANVGRPSKGNESATHISRKRDASSVLARLKRDDPDLAARVQAGELSANAAALRKGWRKPRIVLTDPAAIARSLRKHLSPADLAALRDELR